MKNYRKMLQTLDRIGMATPMHGTLKELGQRLDRNTFVVVYIVNTHRQKVWKELHTLRRALYTYDEETYASVYVDSRTPEGYPTCLRHSYDNKNASVVYFINRDTSAWKAASGQHVSMYFSGTTPLPKMLKCGYSVDVVGGYAVQLLSVW